MISYNHQWKLFWLPQGHAPIYDRFGYFESPDAPRLIGRGNETGVVLPDLERVSWTVLLGELGSGKSSEMQSGFEQCQVEDALHGRGDVLILFTLRACKTRTNLENNIFSSVEGWTMLFNPLL